MSWVVEELASARGVELWRGKVNVDTLLRVAREDASTADSSSGRGVATSHQTVAGRLGMSARHVGTARRILEKLGAAVTIVSGRHLSPQERSEARKAHGGYQEAAGSVRALTMPPLSSQPQTHDPALSERGSSPDAVDTFHLPRRGSVNKQSPVEKYSPTRAGAREKAAARPKLKKTSHARPQRSPRDLDMQRFAWAIAQRFLLSDLSAPRPGAPVRPGVLRGGRHIGNLVRILERNNITPRRYTPQSLADALQRLIQAGKLRSPRFDEIRDHLAHFAWTLRRLNELTEGETTVERIRRESIEREERQCTTAAKPQPTAQELEASRIAAEEFFATSKKLRRPAARERRTDVAELVTAVLGQGIKLYATPPITQHLVGELTLLHKQLTAHGWILSTSPGTLSWAQDEHTVTIDLDTAAAHPISRIVSTTPAAGVVADLLTPLNRYTTRNNYR